MNLYDLASQHNPEAMLVRPFKHRNVILWRNATQVAFLAPQGSVVELCVVGVGKFRIYTRENGAWVMATREEYEAWVKQMKEGTQIELDLQEARNESVR